jgi:hypothetical protein
MGGIMNWKKLLIAFIAIYVVGGVINFIIHGVLLDPTYQELAHLWRPDMENYRWIQWVSPIFLSFFFVYIFAKGYEGRGIMEGIRFGLVIWAFLSIPSNYGQFMVYPLPYHLVLKWVLADLVVLVILGILAAAIYKPLPEKVKSGD